MRNPIPTWSSSSSSTTSLQRRSPRQSSSPAKSAKCWSPSQPSWISGEIHAGLHECPVAIIRLSLLPNLHDFYISIPVGGGRINKTSFYSLIWPVQWTNKLQLYCYMYIIQKWVRHPLKNLAIRSDDSLQHKLYGVCQCVASIRIFQYILISIDEYIHSPKYSCIFSKRIYSDIHSRPFSPLEYIRTLIRIVRFQRIFSNVFIEQNKTCYATNVRQFDLSFIKFYMLYH